MKVCAMCTLAALAALHAFSASAQHSGPRGTEELPSASSRAPAATASLSASASESPPDESRWRLGIAFGHGTRTNPLIQSDDVPILINVDIAWFGERFFFDNGDLGVTAVNGDDVTFNVVARVNSERVFFGKADTRFVRVGVGELASVQFSAPVELEVPDRRYAFELGFELLTDGPWGLLQLTVHHDVGGTHDGYELFIDYAYGWRARRWYFEPSVGAAFKSARLNDYYWGVRPGETGPALPGYRVGSGINPHARFAASYQMTRRWAFAVVAEYERINAAAASSPIVARRDVLGYFAGARLRF